MIARGVHVHALRATVCPGLSLGTYSAAWSLWLAPPGHSAGFPGSLEVSGPGPSVSDSVVVIAGPIQEPVLFVAPSGWFVGFVAATGAGAALLGWVTTQDPPRKRIVGVVRERP